MEPKVEDPTNIAHGCALHGGQAFVAICRRCGTYMCSTCNDGGRFSLCAACREREGAFAFPFRRDGVVWGRLLGFTWQIYQQNFALMTLIVATGLFSFALLQGLSSAAPLLFDSLVLSWLVSLVMSIGQALVLGVFTLGAMGICLRLVRGEPASYEMLLSGIHRLVALIVQGLITNTALSITALFSVAPCAAFLFGVEPSLLSVGLCGLSGLIGLSALLYLALGFTFSTIELVQEPALDPITALKNAWSIARGQRLTIALGWFFIWVLMVLGSMLCFIGLFFTLGYAALLFSALYLALRNGAALER